MIKTFEQFDNEEIWFITVETKEIGTTKYYKFTGDNEKAQEYAKIKSRENVDKNSKIAYRSIEDIIEEDDLDKNQAIEIQKEEIEENVFFTVEEYNEDLHGKYF